MKKKARYLINRREFIEASARSLCFLALYGAGMRSIGLSADSGREYYIKPALMWRKAPKGSVDCLLCPNGCRISDGERGICKVRGNIKGSLYTFVYSRIATAHVDPIEKKPLFHFLPGSKAYSIATAGCNLSCKFCQNWQLSQAFPEDLNAVEITPGELSARAKASGSKVIAYTYNEPTVQFEYIIDSSVVARKNGIRSVIISNGYIRPEAGKKLAENLDAVKIDLKAFTQGFYRDICGGSLKAVQDNLVSVYDTGKWLEIVVLVIPTLNDSPDEIRRMSKWVRDNLSSDVPMHFTRFHPLYKLNNLPPTPVSTLERCRTIAHDQGIKYPYIGNVPGHKWENTFCHSCGKEIIERSGFFHIVNHIKKGKCTFCGVEIPGVWV